MILLTLFILILRCETSLAKKNTIPVFMIDYEGIMKHVEADPNPFSVMSAGYFADILHEAIKRCQVIIIFVENKFSVEDVTSKDKFGTPYYSLHSSFLRRKAKYFPSVTEPYLLLKQMFPPLDINTYHLRSTSNNSKAFDENFKYFYVYFYDPASENRIDTLRRHDRIISDVYSEIHRQNLEGIAFYTGKVNPVDVTSMHYTPIRPSKKHIDGVIVSAESSLYRFKGVEMASMLRRTTLDESPEVSDEIWTPLTYRTQMRYTDFQLQFNFVFSIFHWTLDNVALLEGDEEVGRTSMEIQCPWSYSYYCDEPLILMNTRDGSFVTINEYQIQAFDIRAVRQARTADAYVYGDKGASRPMHEHDPYMLRTWNGYGRAARELLADTSEGYRRNDLKQMDDQPQDDKPPVEDPPAPKEKKPDNTFTKTLICSPYMNIPILSCLFVTFVCLIILGFGITVLYDCQTNDRYDDAHGKPLALGAEQL